MFIFLWNEFFVNALVKNSVVAFALNKCEQITHLHISPLELFTQKLSIDEVLIWINIIEDFSDKGITIIVGSSDD